MASATMNQTLVDALQELRNERARIDAAVAQLERVISGFTGERRRGRPPGSRDGASAHSVDGEQAKPRKRKGWSVEARHAAAERMKRYWAERQRQA